MLVLRRTAFPGKVQSRKLGPQTAPRDLSEFFCLLFADEERGKKGAARYAPLLTRNRGLLESSVLEELLPPVSYDRVSLAQPPCAD